jgi:hypothetical protein
MSKNEQSDDGQDPIPLAPEATSAKAPSEESKVGYGRPPVHTRFKPGSSGNTKGRPKGSRNVKTVVEKVLNEKITLRENGKSRKATKLEAMLQAAAVKAMKGDARALNTILAFMARTGQLIENELEISTSSLPEDDAAIIRDYVRRQIDVAAPSSSNDPEHK